MSRSDEILAVGRRLSYRLSSLSFSAAYVYDTFDYAWDGWQAYVGRWLTRPIEVLLLGMNPGPWGMAQTGVPFGEVAAVGEWLELSPTIGKPRVEHPKRPIDGMACSRSEVSGRRLWGLFAKLYGSPARFFARFALLNYCPLVFMSESGRNITPDKLPKGERLPLLEACDTHLSEVIEILEPSLLVGIGRFAETALKRVAPEELEVRRVLHPSPANPAANRDWEGAAKAALEGVL